jgi:hypothetical protein
METLTLVEPMLLQDDTIIQEEAVVQKKLTKLTQTLERKYDKVFQDGSLISLHISKWGMSAQLNEADLNVEKQPKIFKLGKKMLMDEEIFNVFNRIESRARGYLYRQAFRFPISEAHFISNDKLDEVEFHLWELKQEYDQAKANFLEKYPEYKEAHLAAFPTLREKLEPCYPTVEELETKFDFNWIPYRISMPKELKEYDLNAAIAEEKAVDEVKARAQKELREKAERQTKMLDDFIRDAGQLIRKKVLGACQSIAEKIQRKEVVTPTNIKTLLKQVVDFNSLNFLDDAQVENRLKQLQGVLTDGNEDFKNNDASIEKLETVLNAVIAETSKITDLDDLTGKYFRSIEIDD